MGEIGREVVGDPVGEVVLFRVAAEVLEGQDDDGEAGAVARLSSTEAVMRRGA
jgi:hypothetical protein